MFDSHVVAEGDRITDAMGTRYTYCYQPTPNDVRPGQAKVSGLEALLAVRYSKVFTTLPAHPSLDLRDCAHGCAPGDFGTCTADTWVSFFFVALDASGHQVASFTVDPVTKTVSAKTS